MLAAALTLWAMFSLWIAGPCLGLSRATSRMAAALLSGELIALLGWSYGVDGCHTATCAPLAQAAGVAARLDIPVLAALFVIATVAGLPGPAARRGAARGDARPGVTVSRWPR